MEGTLATVTLFAADFAPKSWAYCAGQLLSISSNTALFSLLGVTYGGDGRVTFGLPDLRGRVVVGAGTGAGLSTYTLGETGGTNNNTLTTINLPQHTHSAVVTAQLQVNGDGATTDNPEGTYFAAASANIYSNSNSGASLNGVHTVSNVGVSGASVPMNNMQPYTGMNYIICMYGIFPSRN